MRVLELFDASNSTIVCPAGTTISARELADDGRRVGERLRGLGRVAGDRIALQLPNGLPYLRLLLACAAARLVVVSVNTRFTDAEAMDVIERSGASLIVGSVEEFETVVHGGARDGAPLDKGNAEDPFMVFTTSGTTNRPKLVRHTQRSVAEHGRNAARSFGYSDADTALVVMPLCGTFGLSSLTAAIAGNCRIILTDRFDPSATGALIERERVTVVNGSDDMFHRLLATDADLSSIRCGGYARFNSSLDGIVGRAWERGCVLVGLYGMSEVQALFAHRSVDAPMAERERAGGTPVSEAADCRIVDGELLLRGPSMFEGYLKEGGGTIDADLTNRAFDGEWFWTGDACTSDGDRRFTYLSRLGDAIRLGGFLVAPAEIEGVIAAFDGITGVQVVAVERPDGARPVAFVTGRPTLSEDAMISALRISLAIYKVPVRIVTVNSFPTTPSANGDKIQLVRLRALATELLESTSDTESKP